MLHKHPAQAQQFECSFGTAHVFYPEANDARCTAALLLDIDPIGLVRDRRGSGNFALEQYVNDRPYVASSFLSVAIAQVFGTALSGICKPRPELVEMTLPFTVTVSPLSSRRGEEELRQLFEPLGYQITIQNYPLDTTFPDWGTSRYFAMQLDGVVRLSDLLSHLYVLIPVLDDEKHYYVGEAEVEKLLRHGEGWLATHPQRNLITNRYLMYKHGLVKQAFTQLLEADQLNPDDVEALHNAEEAQVEKPISLNEQRIGSVVAALKASGAKRVLDLGCAEGQLIRELMKESQFTEIVGLDVAHRSLEIASERLRLDRLPTFQKDRIKLLHGSLTYRDKRIEGFDAAAIVEVIEHLDIPRLAAFERAVFEFAHPRTVIVTTPNGEYNVKFETLPGGEFRHKDHRFEWSRAEFQSWANRVRNASAIVYVSCRLATTIRWLGRLPRWRFSRNLLINKGFFDVGRRRFTTILRTDESVLYSARIRTP